MKHYACNRWPALDLSIKPHSTKDRSGNVDSIGHHVFFKEGKLSTDVPEEIAFIEGSELYSLGIIVKIDPKIEAKKEAEIKELTERSKALGYKLVKA